MEFPYRYLFFMMSSPDTDFGGSGAYYVRSGGDMVNYNDGVANSYGIFYLSGN